jgi:hypothetical protein
MTSLTTYRWLPGRAGSLSPIAISQTAVTRFRTTMVIVGLFLFFLIFPRDERRADATARSRA